jgi:tripartite-type tricarboxylate transporter receptor subunit TctC
MQLKIMRGGAALAGLLGATVVTGDAVAQAYPVKSVRMVNPFSPGGSLDLVSRALSKTMTTDLGQSVYVDNRPGAGGNLGVEIVAKAAPDGYTLLAVQNSITINPSLMKHVPYDPLKDFEPISKISTYMYFLVVHPSTQARSVQQLIALARAKPDQLTYASVGVGSGTHLAGELFKSMARVKMIHVPYKGSGPSIIDLIGGQVALSFGSTSVLPHVLTKKLILLGVSGAQRSSFVPDAPTISESGVPGYEVIGWNALFAPAGTPAPIISKLNQLVRQGLMNADTKAVMEAQGLDATPSTPQELRDAMRDELAKWAKVIKTAGIKPE